MGKGKRVFFAKTVHFRADSCIGGGGAMGAGWARQEAEQDEDGMLVAVGLATFSPCWL
jgi:hypothetical protein